MAKRYNILAIVGFVLSFLGLLAIPGIILCIIALIQIPKNKEKGQGLAVAGIIVGIVAILISSMIVLIPFLFFNVNAVRGSGNIIAATYNVTDFVKISIEGQGDLFITQAEDFSVKIETDDNILERLKVVVRSDTLVIGPENSYSGFRLKPSESIDIFVSMPVVENIAISGFGNVKSTNTLTGDSLTLSISGAGNSDLDLIFEELNTVISGAGQSKLRGKVDMHNIHVSGVADIDAFNLETKRTDISTSGAGNAEVFTTEHLEIQISGAGDISYKGNPTVSQSVSGTGKIRKVE